MLFCLKLYLLKLFNEFSEFVDGELLWERYEKFCCIGVFMDGENFVFVVVGNGKF